MWCLCDIVSDEKGMGRLLMMGVGWGGLFVIETTMCGGRALGCKAYNLQIDQFG